MPRAAIVSQILETKQALSLQQGRHQDERPSMLFRTFAVCITLGLSPMSAQWITTFGLLLDIFGAFLVATEVVSKFHGDQFLGPKEYNKLADNPPKTPEFAEWERKKFIKMAIGLTLLTLGFLLQIAGTWIPTWLQTMQKT